MALLLSHVEIEQYCLYITNDGYAKVHLNNFNIEEVIIYIAIILNITSFVKVKITFIMDTPR